MDPRDVEETARDFVARLERAWNDGDGTAFAAPFGAEADFVNVRGEHHRGRAAIAAGHQAIFASIYRGSRLQYEVVQARALTPDVLLVHVHADLDIPAGPLAGRMQAIPSLVLVRGTAGWEAASFHNTPVAPPRPGAG